MRRRDFASLLALPVLAQPVSRQLAITIDDIPRGGDRTDGNTAEECLRMTRQLMRTLKQVPVTAFINPGRERQIGEAGLDAVLQEWKRQGAELGNHSFSHRDLNRTPLAEYEADILKAEPAIRKARGGTPSRYFRHPFLHTGPDKATREGLEAFLKEHKFEIAPVTFDTSDWMFARVFTTAKDPAYVKAEYLKYMTAVTEWFEKRSVEVVGSEIPQILLIHANQLNAEAMPELLAMYRSRGYRFIGLDEALKHPAYRLEDGYYGRNGMSWLHRWAIPKGIAPASEPDTPKWLQDAYSGKK